MPRQVASRNNGEKVTLAVIATKLDQLAADQADFYTRFEKHCADDVNFQRDMWTTIVGKENTPGLSTRIDRMEQNELRRQRQWWIVYTAAISAIALQIGQWIKLLLSK